MGNSLYISTIEAGSGKALVALGIINLFLRKTTKVNFFKPVIQSAHPSPAPGKSSPGQDEDIALILQHFGLQQTDEESFGLRSHQINNLRGRHQIDQAIAGILDKFKVLEHRGDFVLCEGSDYLDEGTAFEFNLNQEIAKNLGCPILVLGNADHRSVDESIRLVQIAVDAYRKHHCQIAGIVLNKAAPEQVDRLKTALEACYGEADYVLAVIPYDRRLLSPRMRDIAQQLQAEVLYGHELLGHLATNVLVAAMQMQHALTWLREDSLIITPGDRGDMIVGVLQAHLSINYPNLAGMLLSTGLKPEPAIAKLFEGLPAPLPILSVKTDTYTTASQIQAVHSSLNPEDHEKIDLSLRAFEQHVDLARLEEQVSLVQQPELTPQLFTYQLMQQAKADPRHIVLPESTDLRILKAAAVLRSRKLATLTLLGKREDIERVIKRHSIQLDLEDLTIVNPSESPHLDDYAHTFYRLRKHKGATLDIAYDYMLDATYYGTMMVYRGDADGMVSGAAHTTQHTIRPALQLIKAKPGVALVSSVFLMYLGEHVRVYGDCAVNANPDAAQLADIAIASADTAQAFGIEPRVALLSYSSGDSAQGEDVEKVRQATHLARQRRPDLPIEGPIQYDAAVDPEVAAHKFPGTAGGGQATVLVFPDLNTGNNTYKAVQRETGAIAIGPILQGLKKPVNDLSRGCTVNDIVNTVVITAIQAQAAREAAVSPPPTAPGPADQ
ncbi:phosphate acetyltransferase [Nodosilinea sp. LEGE 07088]|uniref:phosphate acetyltransferase n=1 Tax=Nodosilinea sp. LEGE 07088 TaxID=2777968 RepID=UPI00187F0A76|nr:phosphate acetyltransferase [Nodosilinea sp. LEGE 07088]MBE9137077.1 phosphate acetyltransferase [Nodosilinea sp. LEGE 07088]